jgi:hypothetical protein
MQAHKEATSGSRGHSVRRNSAFSLLTRILPNQKIEHKMAEAIHGVTSARYDGSGSSPPQTPEKTGRKSTSVKEDRDQSADELDQNIYADRKSSAGHSLRPRKALTLSIKAAENGDKMKLRNALVCFSVTCISTFSLKSKAFI